MDSEAAGNLTARLRTLSILYEAVSSLGTKNEPSEEIGDLAEVLCRSLVLEAVAVFEVQEGEDALGAAELFASFGIPRRRRRLARLTSSRIDELRAPALGDGPLKLTLLGPQEVAEALQVPGDGEISAWCAPVHVPGRHHADGILVVGSRSGTLNGLTQDVLSAIIPRVGISLKRSREGAAVRSAQQQLVVAAYNELKSARALSEQETLNAKIMDASHDGIMIFDEQDVLQQANAAALRMLGADGEEVPRLHISAVIPEMRPAGYAVGDAGGGPPLEAPARESQLMRLDGLPVSVEVVEASVPTRSGQKMRAVFAHDLSRRIQQEEARLQDERDIHHAHRLEALGTLAAGVAHYFNNGLATILGSVELVEGAPTPELRAAGLRRIRTAAENASSLVRQMLTYARQSEGEGGARSDAAAGALEAADFVRPAVGAGVDILVDCPDGVAPVPLTAAALQLVLVNLLTNAAQAVPRPGGVVRVQVSVLAGSDDEYADERATVLIALEDNGPGIPEDLKPRVFEPFFSTKEVGKGTGLGLAQVQGIITEAGGHVGVLDASGGGARFEIRLPLVEDFVDEAPSEPVPPRASETAQPLTVNVLLVDDNEDLAWLTSHMLESRGAAVRMFGDPREALDSIRTEPAWPGILVTDMAMPGLSGAELVAAIAEVRPDLPVLIVSGGVGTDEVLETLDVPNPVRGLDKPFSAESFIQTVEQTSALRVP